MNFKEEIKRKVEKLEETKEWVILPPLPIKEVAKFEEVNEIRLPDDFKCFITQISNGIRQVDGVSDFNFHGLKFTKDYGYYIFTPEFCEAESWDEVICDLKTSFKPTVAFNMEVEGIDEYIKKISEVGCGYIVLSDSSIGDGYNPILIVNGVCYGEVWEESYGCQEGYYPLTNGEGTRVSFTDWITHSLKQELE